MLLRSLLVLTLAGTAALAQSDEEKKKALMDKVRAKLERDRQALLEKISKLIDDELGLKSRPSDGTGKRVQEIEKRLRQLEEEKARLLVELREAKWWEQDAKLIEEAKKEELTPQEANDLFKEALDDHNNKNYDKSIPAFKKIFYLFCKHENERIVQFAGISAYNVACGYALWGKKEEALDWLEISFAYGFNDIQDQCHETPIEHTENDSDLDLLRNEQRYKDLIRRFKK